MNQDITFLEQLYTQHAFLIDLLSIIIFVIAACVLYTGIIITLLITLRSLINYYKALKQRGRRR